MGYAMWASVRDGILVGVRFDTTGVHEQDRVLNQLRDKFGQPTSFNREPMQNLLGMKFERYVAVWKGTQVYVEFNGVLDEIDYGLVSIETPAEHARRVRSLQESRPPKL